MSIGEPLADDAALTGKDFNRLHDCVHMVDTKLAAHIVKFDAHCVEVSGKLGAIVDAASNVEQRFETVQAATAKWRVNTNKRATATSESLRRLGGKVEASLDNQRELKNAFGLNGGKKTLATMTTPELGRRALLFVGMVGGGGAGLAWLYRFVASVWPSVNHFLLTR